MNYLLFLCTSLLLFSGHDRPVKSKTNVEAAHPFHVSIAELNIAEDTLQVSLRVFTDDLEFALREMIHDKVFLSNPTLYEKNYVVLRDYLFNRVRAGDGGKTKALEWLGFEFEDDVCWIYGQLPVDPEMRILFFKTDILTEIYDDQQNMVHLKTPDGYETALATAKNNEVRFTRP